VTVLDLDVVVVPTVYSRVVVVEVDVVDFGVLVVPTLDW